ncbi:hypothetical protein MAR_011418 [Mya arenaria]|uniref:Uncharacterized protein n=1 Tax=Mya arenaria TaxID=6604 RepID=A0ABY7FXU9_MYAAR|nr:hypothetical protein MAR_011365 [Mya arenaria]WAR25714.1 hypothetical protein MAR_011418 [Mya arenaria]
MDGWCSLSDPITNNSRTILHLRIRGTFFFHNRIRILQMLGLNGALIVRERTQNASEEHVVLISIQQ